MSHRSLSCCTIGCLIFALAITTNCSGATRSNSLLQPTRSWQYTDLRILDPTDASKPEFDLVAVYHRQIGDEIQLRLDWLDQPMLPVTDLFIAIDTIPGGKTELPFKVQNILPWDVLLILPANGPLQALDASYAPIPDIAMHVYRENIPDSLEISLNQRALGDRPQHEFQIFVIEPGTNQVMDEISPFSNDSQPPPPARILFAFWNTYPAYTPLMALRRWDGAHAGPLGGRHGLYNLLRTAQSHQMPLVLLDLKNPAALQALRYTGYIDYIRTLQAQNLLILPEYIPTVAPANDPSQGWLAEHLANQSQAISQLSGLPANPFIYSPSGIVPNVSGGLVQFVLLPSEDNQLPSLHTIQAWRWKEQRVIPVTRAISAIAQASSDGISLELRRALVAAAIEGQNYSGFLVLGGDLIDSAWGNPQSARIAFRYLAEHPWVQPLNTDQLLSLPTSQAPKQIIQALHSSPYQPELTPEEHTTLLAAMQSAPSGPIMQVVWEAYLNLFTPVSSAGPDLAALRREYIGQVWSLLNAADWAADPAQLSDCSTDVDHDEQPECILANANLYAQFEPESGTLTCLITRYSLWIGPSSLSITGLSDPSTWRKNQSLASDPAVIPGAFTGSRVPYQTDLQDMRLTFSSPDYQVHTTYSLGKDTLEIAYQFLDSLPFEKLFIPILNIPTLCPAMTWHNCLTVSGDERTLRLNSQASGEILLIQANNVSMNLHSYKDTDPSIFSSSENPNMDYSLGLIWPFPLSMIDLTYTGDFSIKIQILNP